MTTPIGRGPRARPCPPRPRGDSRHVPAPERVCPPGGLPAAGADRGAGRGGRAGAARRAPQLRPAPQEGGKRQRLHAGRARAGHPRPVPGAGPHRFPGVGDGPPPACRARTPIPTRARSTSTRSPATTSAFTTTRPTTGAAFHRAGGDHRPVVEPAWHASSTGATHGRPPVDLALKTDPGTLVLFNGDKLWHAITPLGEGEERVSLTLEYVTDPTCPRSGAWSPT